MSDILKTREFEGEEYVVRKVCSWCGKDMGEAGFTSKERGIISHGICPECVKKFEEDIEEMPEEVKN